MALATSHLLPADSTIEDGRLAVAGCDAVALAREFGTPAYVLAERDLRERARTAIRALAEHHDGPGEIVFASKALPCTAVLSLFAEEGLGCDVASGGELHLALRAGFDPARLYLHGNAKSDDELRMAIAAGVGTIVLDHPEEAERLEALVPPGERAPVLIRVTPGIDADTHASILTGQAGSKFGMPPADAAAVAARPWQRLQVEGLHVHIGSQLYAPGPRKGGPDPWRRAAAALAAVGRFATYDLGGGLAVPYTREDPPTDLAAWVALMAEAARDSFEGPFRLVLEPGRALVASAGLTLYTVQAVKPGAAGELIVAVDGGMSDNLRPMLYGASYEAMLADRPDEAGGEPCQVVGKHCESGDVLVRDARLAAPRPGDVIAVPVTGAYSHAMANNYNGVPRPPVVMCAGGEARAVVRRETYEDLHARDL
jgi:diaminopimelate decarboxylase